MFIPRFRRLKKRVPEESKAEEFTAATSGLTLDQLSLERAASTDAPLPARSVVQLRVVSAERGLMVCEHMKFDAKELRTDDVMMLLRLLDTATIEWSYQRMGLDMEAACDYDHFTHVWKDSLARDRWERSVLERAFMFFDQDGSGFITRQEMIAQFNELGGVLTDAEINRFHDILDTDGDGVIDYQEFVAAMSAQSGDRLLSPTAVLQARLPEHGPAAGTQPASASALPKLDSDTTLSDAKLSDVFGSQLHTLFLADAPEAPSVTADKHSLPGMVASESKR